MSNAILTALTAVLFIAIGFLIFLPLLPIAALFFMWLWNDVVHYLNIPHIITYWESLKLCFLVYVLRGIFNAKLTVSKKEAF